MHLVPTKTDRVAHLSLKLLAAVNVLLFLSFLIVALLAAGRAPLRTMLGTPLGGEDGLELALALLPAAAAFVAPAAPQGAGPGQ